MELITVDKIKELFEYPIGIKDKDKFYFEDCSVFDGEGTATIYIPQNNSRIRIEITEELARSLSDDWIVEDDEDLKRDFVELVEISEQLSKDVNNESFDN